MNVYMIDDNPDKQANFLQILTKANECATSLGIDYKLRAGFGTDSGTAAKDCVRAETLLKALLDDGAVYLVDLILTKRDSRDESSIKDERLIYDEYLRLKALLGEFPRPWCGEALRLLAMFQQHEDILVQKVATAYPLAMLILCCCRAANASALLVSTDASSEHVKCVGELALAAQEPPKSFPSSDAKDKVIEVWAQALLGLLDELGRVRRKTSSWFSERYVKGGWKDDRGLPHDIEEMPISDHQRIVRSVFPWAPESWWSSAAATQALHQCLKFSIGYHASWTNSIGEKPLCLAGAYLLFLIAIAQRFPGRFQSLVTRDWTPFVTCDKPIDFLPEQSHKDAEQTVRSLYEFFCLIRVKKSADPTSAESPLDMLGIDRVELPERSLAGFRLKLTWDPAQSETFSREFSTRIGAGLSTATLLLPTAKATSALIRFILASHTRNTGLGALGMISLEESNSGAFLQLGRW